MKQTVRHGLGIALSAMAFLCNYSPWVREAASLPDALTLTSGQKFVVQTGLPMLAASDGGAVSVLASQDEDSRRTGRRRGAENARRAGGFRRGEGPGASRG